MPIPVPPTFTTPLDPTTARRAALVLARSARSSATLDDAEALVELAERLQDFGDGHEVTS